MNRVETFTMEPAAQEQMSSRRTRRFVRRKRYDRVPLDAGFGVRLPRKLKVANLDFRPVKRTLAFSIREDAPAPSWVWKMLGAGFVAGMADDSPTASRDLSLVPVRPPKSHGGSYEIQPEPEISFTLSVLEESYEEHLRNAFGGRYA